MEAAEHLASTALAPESDAAAQLEEGTVEAPCDGVPAELHAHALVVELDHRVVGV